MTKIFHFVIMITLVLVCSGCVSMLRIDGPYEGKVVDADTNQPIEGAVVHATWHKKYLGGGSEYYGSYEVLTDQNGEFRIPGQGLLIFSNVDDMMPKIFKAEYSQLPTCSWKGLRGGSYDMVSWQGNKVTIRLKRMTLEERRKRSVLGPDDVPNKDEKLFMRERNKDSIEIGRGPFYPAELLK